MRVGYPDTMNKKGPSPLKVRYASSGEGEDLEAVSIDVAEKDPAKQEERKAKRAEKKANKKTSGGASGTSKGSEVVKKIGAGIKKIFGG